MKKMRKNLLRIEAMVIAVIMTISMFGSVNVNAAEIQSENGVSVATEKAVEEMEQSEETVEVDANVENSNVEMLTESEKADEDFEEEIEVTGTDEASEISLMYVDEPEYLIQAGGFEILDEVLGANVAGAQDAIYQGLKERAESINISSYSISEDDIRAVYYGVVNEHPELYYAGTALSYRTSGNKVLEVYPSYKNTPEDAIFNRAVDKAMSVVKSEMSDLEKAVALHDYLALNVKYNSEVANETVYDGEAYIHNSQNPIFSAYGALVNQDAVCQGYALAYKLLLNKAGIECGVVTSDAMGHEWNYVKLDGNYYYVDVTWDDPVFGEKPGRYDLAGFVQHTNMFVSFDTLHIKQKHQAFKKDEKTNVVYEVEPDWVITRNGMGASYETLDTATDKDNAWWRSIYGPFVWANDGETYYKAGWYLYKGDILHTKSETKCRVDANTYGLFMVGERVYFVMDDELKCLETDDSVSFSTLPGANTPITSCGINYKPLRNQDVVVIQSGANEPQYYSISFLSGEKEYAVTFVDSEDNVLRETQYVLEGHSASAPSIEPRKGYTARWSDDFSEVHSDMTISLIYEPIKYTITYKLVKPDAVNGENPETYTIEDTVAFETPTCPGYIFNGWYPNETYSGATVSTISRRTGNIVLYAKWTPVKPAAPEIKAEPSAVLPTGNILVDAGTVVTIVGEEKSNVRYTTDGSNPTATSKIYTGGIIINEKTTINAICERDSVVSQVVSKTLEIANNEFALQDDVALEAGETHQITAVTLPTSKAFTDISFSSSSNAVATVSDSGVITAIGDGTAIITATITDWRGRPLQDTLEVAVTKNYKVTFVGFDNNVIKEQVVRSGGSAEAPDMSSESLVPNGYEFKCWDKPFVGVTEDVTVYARFETKTYYIFFVNDEGENPPFKTYDIVSEDIVLPDSSEMTAENKNFVGWYDNEAYDGSPISRIKAVTCEDIKLYAKWATKATLTMKWDIESKYLQEVDGEKVAFLPYTGKAQTPAFTVYYGDTKLENKKDYTYKFVNNVNANYSAKNSANEADITKTPTLIITGKGNYAGVEKVYFNIIKKDIRKDDIDVVPVSLAYNKKTQKVAPVVTWNGKKLTTKELSFDYNSVGDGVYINVGSYNVEIAGKGNFEYERNVELNIFNTNVAEADSSILIKNCKVSITPFDYTDEGLTKADIISHVKVTYGKNNTVPYYEDDVDENGYDIELAGGTVAKDIGTYTVRIWGKGIYKGEIRTTFKINGLNVSTMKVAPVLAQIYDGTVKEPELTITSKTGDLLVKDTHYTLDYQKNVDVGTATVVITGINSYFGSRKVSFKIKQKVMAVDSADWNDISISLLDYKAVEGHEYGCYEYTKGGVTPKLEVKYAGKTLQEKVDYTLAYKNNNTATPVAGKEPYIVLTLKKNIKGTKNIRFDIVHKDLDDKEIIIKVNDVQESTQPGKYKSTPAMYDVNGKKLDSKDYDIEYTYEGSTTPLDKYSKPEAGKVIKVTVKGKGNYIGSKKATYRVYAKGKSIASASIKVDPNVLKSLEYNGQPVVLEEDNLEVKLGKTTVLVANKDYVIDGNSYVNNTNKGTAKVTILGKGDYAGSKTISFSIKPWYLKWWIF